MEGVARRQTAEREFAVIAYHFEFLLVTCGNAGSNIECFAKVIFKVVGFEVKIFGVADVDTLLIKDKRVARRIKGNALHSGVAQTESHCAARSELVGIIGGDAGSTVRHNKPCSSFDGRDFVDCIDIVGAAAEAESNHGVCGIYGRCSVFVVEVEAARIRPSVRCCCSRTAADVTVLCGSETL